MKRPKLGLILLVLAIALIVFFQTDRSLPTLVWTADLTKLYGLLTFASLILVSLIWLVDRWWHELEWYRPVRDGMLAGTIILALCHISFGFFYQLGGFQGLKFLTSQYLIAMSLGLVNIVSLLFVFMAVRWHKRWLPDVLAVTVVLAFIHALMLGTHYTNLNLSIIAMVSFAAVAVVLLLEAWRLDRWLAIRLTAATRFGFVSLLTTFLIGLGLLLFQSQSGSVSALNVHAVHLQLAQEAQSTAQNPLSGLAGTALQGDKTKRYTVSLNYPADPEPNQPLTLQFQIFDAATGLPVTRFSRVYEQLIHLIIVDSQLDFFAHVHPANISGTSFSQTITLPHAGLYHLYLDFQPTGAIEQQIGLSIPIGEVNQAERATQPIDTDLTKTVEGYQVSLAYPSPAKATDLSVGKTTLRFTVHDSSGKPVTTLKPYLGAFGHLTLINEATYDYIHVHPTTVTPPKPTDQAGPTVDFLPLGLYGPIKPGVYRLFVQLNPNGHLITADFTIEVK